MKIVAFIALAQAGWVKPFAGSNAEDHYLPIAQRLLSVQRFNDTNSRPDSKVPPVYPVLIAAVMAIAPQKYPVLLVLLNLCFDGIIGFWIAFLGGRLGNSRLGTATAVLWLLFPPAIAISSWITAETLFTTLLIGSLAILLVPHPTVATCSASGVIMGLATLTRSTPLYLPLIFVVGRIPRKPLLLLPFLAGMVAMIAPWTVRNLIVLSDPILVSVGAGSVFLQGSDERTFTISGKASYYPSIFREAAQHGVIKPDDPRESGIDGWLFRVGRYNWHKRLGTDPISVVPFMAKKTARLWYATESGGFRPQLALCLCSLLIVPAALLQLWGWRGEHGCFVRVVIGVVIYFATVHIMTLPLVRYVLPIYPLLMLPAVSWWHDLFQKVRAPKPR